MTAVAETPAPAPRARGAASAVMTIWKRELLRWWRDKTRMVASAAIPLIFLLMLGSGLSGTVGTLLPGEAQVDLELFIFPGVVAMAVLLTATYSALSLVYDREFGILKGVLVAPVSHAAVVWGKTLGGASVATLQGTLALAFAPVVGARLDPWLVLRLWPIMFLAALALTSLSVATGARMRSVETYQVVNQLVALPLIFLSGIFFPLRGLPVWMETAVRLNPFSYAVDPLRRLVLEGQGLPADALGELGASGLALTIGGRQLSVVEDVAIVVGFTVLAQFAAVRLISHSR